MITGELKGKVDKLWTHFWNNGISNPISVIEQISYLLFMRRLDDEEINKENKARRIRKPVENPTFSPEQQDCRWSKFRELNPEEKLATVRDRAFPLIKNLGGEASESAYAKHMKEAVFLIASPALLSQAIEQIDNIIDGIQEQARNSPDESYVDLMGDLYEYMLSKLSQAGTNGQFRTPRHIIKLMVELMEPTEREVVCDPACGTAGFLVGVAEYLNKRKQSELMAQENREHFKGGMFHGFDFDGTMLRIGSMNMMLHGIENPTIEARDSLSEDHASVEEAFTLVLANPPFKGSVSKDSIAKDLTQVVKTTKTELLFVALFLRLLKLGGRCAAIVPDGVLFGSSRAHKAIRKALVEEHKLDGIVSMPSGVFKPYAGVSTAILMFTKTGAGGTDNVWFYDMEADGFSLDDKRQPVEENDIPDILARWQSRDASKEGDRKGKAFFVPKAEIVENGYDLSINRYKEIEYEEVEYDPPLEILAKLRGLEAEIRADLDELEGLLK
ncbi:MAG: SAM-dependent DNA methyltransferase [Cyanobacteria bacterium SID2]|nr:SAM-dependent DNA methyltransferase [Cyanobacteria bacterium SID2]